MKLNYFNQNKADKNDMILEMAIMQGYVPKTCLLNGAIVMSEITCSRDPCAGCNCPRDKCHGRPRQAER